MSEKDNKRSTLTGWCSETVISRLKNLERIKHSGDWRRAKFVRHLQVCTASITWSKQSSAKDDLVLTSPVPTGMVDLFQQLDKAQNRTVEALPLSVKNHFDVTKKNYKPSDFTHTVTFSGL